MNELVNYQAARRALAQARRIDEVRAVKDKARAVELYAIEAKDREMEMWAVEIRTRAERRAGELLIEMKRNGARDTGQGGNRRSPSAIVDGEKPVTLARLGIKRDESADWQKLARIKEPEFERRVKLSVAQRQRPATHEILRRDHQQRTVVDSSRTPAWNTPPEIVGLVIEVLGAIDLDPCSDRDGKKANVPAAAHFTESADGLAQRWQGRVYMNPPYGDAVGKWVTKFREAYESGDLTEGIALVAARTDTQWFQEFADLPVCFLKGRLKFSGAETGATFPSAVLYAGRRLKKFAQVFGPRGILYVPYHP